LTIFLAEDFHYHGQLGNTISNNTVDYAAMSSAYKSAYIDLLHGDAYMCTIADANGAPTSDYAFEDYLQNISNVVGTSGSDIS
jgi:hypothetical protein